MKKKFKIVLASVMMLIGVTSCNNSDEVIIIDDTIDTVEMQCDTIINDTITTDTIEL